MRKCVFGSSPEVEEEEEEEDKGCGGASEEARAATVREAAVPLWAERRCTVRRELRKPLAV